LVDTTKVGNDAQPRRSVRITEGFHDLQVAAAALEVIPVNMECKLPRSGKSKSRFMASACNYTTFATFEPNQLKSFEQRSRNQRISTPKCRS
jgi:hypothetical protein